jgi:integrase
VIEHFFAKSFCVSFCLSNTNVSHLRWNQIDASDGINVPFQNFSCTCPFGHRIYFKMNLNLLWPQFVFPTLVPFCGDHDVIDRSCSNELVLAVLTIWIFTNGPVRSTIKPDIFDLPRELNIVAFNRMLALLRAILIRSVTDWNWLSSVPRVRLLREPVRRVRYLSQFQAKRLLAELPAHLSLMAAFSLATGLRRGNVTGLLWSQIDIGRRLAWVHPDQSKNRKAIAVPLNADAVRVVLTQSGKHQTHVFTYNGVPVKQLSTAAWYKALKRAGIDDFRWHDLRHTWASWHVQNGTPLYVLQELGGWENSEMMRRYAHFSASHLAVYADGLGSLMAA